MKISMDVVSLSSKEDRNEEELAHIFKACVWCGVRLGEIARLVEVIRVRFTREADSRSGQPSDAYTAHFNVVMTDDLDGGTWSKFAANFDAGIEPALPFRFNYAELGEQLRKSVREAILRRAQDLDQKASRLYGMAP